MSQPHAALAAHGLPLAGPRPEETQPLEAVGGIEITDLDLSQPLTDAVRQRLLDTFRAHPILVFRNQRLSKEQQFDFTTNFGEVETRHVGRFVDSQRYTAVHTVSNLDHDGNPSEILRERGNYYWHSDKSYHAVPSLLTMLHAIELPPRGGQTQFANTAMAYAALPEATKQRIATLRAEHSWEASRLNSLSPPATEEQKRERPPVDHPIVRTHPDTGAKTIYLGNHASHILGWPYDEGRALIAELMAHATQGAFVYTHAWRRGDLVMWDNRCLLHRALPHEGMGRHRRVLHRTVVIGTVPF
jgi:alpha-ketoglutarate-dependent taurine dioxygenase